MTPSTPLLALLLAAALALVAVPVRAGQSDITGEPMLYRINPGNGTLADRDLDLGGPAFHRDSPIMVTVNSIFLRYLRERFGGNPHVLVYSEVYDDGADNPETAHRRVIYNGEATPQNTLLGVSDRVIYGPAPFKGFPVRIKLVIVELDKQDKNLFTSLLGGLNQFAQVMSASSAATVGQLLQVGSIINALNSDDFELRFDLTLHPPRRAGKLEDVSFSRRNNSHYYLNAPLIPGSYVVLKRESAPRGGEHESFITTGLYDNAQDNQYWHMTCAGKELKNVQQALRFEGGYLYWIVTDPEIEKKKAQAALDNTECPWLTQGHRMPYHQRTYLTLSVAPAPADARLSDEAQKELSRRDWTTIQGLLDKPDGPGLGPAAEAGLRQTTAMVAADVIYRDAIRRAARIADALPEFRASTAYPLFWFGQLRPVDKGDAYERELNRAFDDRLLRLLGEIVPDLPPAALGAQVDAKHIACLKKLGAGDLTPNTPASGYFAINDPAKLNTCLAPAQPADQAGSALRSARTSQPRTTR